jgi:SAM-dependent methyltransferase
MWDDADLYELETAWYTQDLPYWAWLLAEVQPRHLLELACGTGRLALPLARQRVQHDPGFRLMGLDRSAALLVRAQEKLAETEPALTGVVQWVEGDMRTFDLGERFDLIILGFNALAYLPALEDQVACLRAIRRHLAPGGRFALDLLVPLAAFLAECQGANPPMRVELDHAVPALGVSRFLRCATDRYDPATQSDDSAYFYEIYYADGRVERRTDTLRWHMYFPRELLLLLRLAGLVPVAQYGSYARTPFNGASDKYLWVMAAA